MRIVVQLIIFISTMILVSCSKKDIDTIPSIMPNDFALSFSYGVDESQLNILNTYKGTIQKDLILDGIADIDYLINEENLEKIYSMIRQCRIYEITKTMTSENLTTTNERISIEPCTYYNINFTIKGTEYSVAGDATVFSYKDTNIQAKAFCEFLTYIIQYLNSTQEYKSLPEGNGGYD